MRLPSPRSIIVASFVCSFFLSIPARAQVDFSGEWSVRYHEDQEERSPGGELGDYTGMPLNDAGRLRANTFSAALYGLDEWQCRPHASTYMWRSVHPVRITKDVDPVDGHTIALDVNFQDLLKRKIYLDGRPHPDDDAEHTWAGFSTGRGEGDMLTVSTTHLKEYIVRRDGVPTSDRATMTEHWMRHDDYLTIVQIVQDPVYLTEPFIQSTDFIMDPHIADAPELCEVEEEQDHPRGWVPRRTPEEAQRDQEAFSKKHNIPLDAVKGGAETMYPDYRKKITQAQTGQK